MVTIGQTQEETNMNYVLIAMSRLGSHFKGILGSITTENLRGIINDPTHTLRDTKITFGPLILNIEAKSLKNHQIISLIVLMQNLI